MKKTILLADDSTTIQRLVAQTFEEGDDFKVVAVSNGDAAVRKFDEIHPTLVLADVFMPGKTGYEVCEYVREHPLLERTPVILLVGAFERFDEAEALRVGAYSKVSKPFEPQELFELVSKAIEGTETALPGQPDAEDDILGLSELFPHLDLEPKRAPLTADDIEIIADRVIARLSSEVIEGVAWEIVPDIAERIVREAMKRHDEH